MVQAFMMPTSFRRALLAATLLTIGCGDSSGTTSDPAPSGPGSPGSGSCPVTLVDGASYNGILCDVQGIKTFAPGVYQIEISATFNSKPPIRSVAFTVNDSDLATESHIKSFPVGTANPGVNATYNVSPINNVWATLENMTAVGSGSFVVTEYDRTNKLISGTFDVVVKQGATSKTITGTLTHVPMKRAD